MLKGARQSQTHGETPSCADPTTHRINHQPNGDRLIETLFVGFYQQSLRNVPVRGLVW